MPFTEEKNTKNIDLPPIFIKVGKKENLERLVENGEIYFGAAEFYRGDEKPNYLQILANLLYNKGDQKLATFDPLESASSIIYPSNPDENVNVKFHQKHSHILSLYGFAKLVDIDFKISDNMKNFGYDSFTIFDSKFFLLELDKALQGIYIPEDKAQPEYGYVKYYDLTPGENIYELTQFHKKGVDFGYQMEYRVLANLPHDISKGGGFVITLNRPLYLDSNLGKTSKVYPLEELYKIGLIIK